MRHFMRILFSGLGIILAASLVPAFAGEPTDQLKETIDRVLAIVNDPGLKEPERQKLIRREADDRFYWGAIARSAMGIYWRDLTPEQKTEFTALFADLIESVYMGKIESYSGEKIRYLGDETKGGYGTVEMSISTRKGTEIPIKYRVTQEKGRWLIYDVQIEGVDMVNNYRSQIKQIMNNSSYEGLVKKLKEKVETRRKSTQ